MCAPKVNVGIINFLDPRRFRSMTSVRSYIGLKKHKKGEKRKNTEKERNPHLGFSGSNRFCGTLNEKYRQVSIMRIETGAGLAKQV